MVGHHGHDHGPLLESIFTGNEVVPDVLDVAPTKDLKVILRLIRIKQILINIVQFYFRLNTLMKHLWTLAIH